MPHLEIRNGRHAGKTYDLTGNVILGRGETADIQLPDGKASREHARVFKQAGKWAVADLNSRNGIKVNGLKATRKDLFDGDQFEVGETLVAFVGEGGAAVRAAAAADDVDELDLGGGDDGPENNPAAPPARQAAAPPSRAAAKTPPGKSPSRSSASGSSKTSAKDAAFAAARQSAADKRAGASGRNAPAATGGIQVSDNVLQFSKVDASKSSFLSIEISQYSAFTQFLMWCGIVALFGGLIWFVFKSMADAAL